MLKDEEKQALERSDIIIDENTNTASWNIQVEGAIQGTYLGNFRFKCYLSPTEQIATNREYRELLGINPAFATEHESFLAYALTQLKYRVIQAPPFWTTKQSGFSGDLPDDNVLSSVLDAALGAEIKFKAMLKKKKFDAAERARVKVDEMIKGDDDDVDPDDLTEEPEDQKV